MKTIPAVYIEAYFGIAQDEVMRCHFLGPQRYQDDSVLIIRYVTSKLR